MIARLLIGSREERIEKIKSFLERSGLKNPHPDLFYFDSDSKLGIAEARKINDFFSLKPYSGKSRAVILEDASHLTDEAQNALLKTLEELPESALFILCANSDAAFLPTVLSRCQIIRVQGIGYRVQGYTEDIEKLINSTVEQRFEYIEKLKDREEFFLSLLVYFHQKLPANFKFTKELLQAEQWQKQNVNLRAILEYLMLVMPFFDKG